MNDRLTLPCVATGDQPSAPAEATPVRTMRRIRSQDVLGREREVEIEHEGRVYRLRVTQLNKLILTA